MANRLTRDGRSTSARDTRTASEHAALGDAHAQRANFHYQKASAKVRSDLRGAPKRSRRTRSDWA